MTTPAGGELSLLLCFAVRAFQFWVQEALVSDLPSTTSLHWNASRHRPMRQLRPNTCILLTSLRSNGFFLLPGIYAGCQRHNDIKMKMLPVLNYIRNAGIVGPIIMLAHCVSWFTAPHGLRTVYDVPSHSGLIVSRWLSFLCMH